MSKQQRAAAQLIYTQQHNKHIITIDYQSRQNHNTTLSVPFDFRNAHSTTQSGLLLRFFCFSAWKKIYIRVRRRRHIHHIRRARSHVKYMVKMRNDLTGNLCVPSGCDLCAAFECHQRTQKQNIKTFPCILKGNNTLKCAFSLKRPS